MFDCHKDILAYHDEKVTLPGNEQSEMRERRNANRNRLRGGLERDGHPKPVKFQSQGSYAHHTMVQHPKKDYDIDDGVYFSIDDLTGPRGGELAPHDAKERVRIGLDDKQFIRPPEVRTNCVRVYYKPGYHIDVPVYRIVESTDIWGRKTTHFEIASSTWKVSDPAAVTDWFNDENNTQSPDDSNGRQLRRMVRMLKAFARSRETWRKMIASGFTITVLVVECYRADAGREDRALYDTMQAIRDRLKLSLAVNHPVVEGEMLAEWDDAKTKFLLERLEWALEQLQVLSEWDCDQEAALKAWGKVFGTDFFGDRVDSSQRDAMTAVGGSAPALQPRRGVSHVVSNSNGRFA